MLFLETKRLNSARAGSRQRMRLPACQSWWQRTPSPPPSPSLVEFSGTLRYPSSNYSEKQNPAPNTWFRIKGGTTLQKTSGSKWICSKQYYEHLANRDRGRNWATETKFPTRRRVPFSVPTKTEKRMDSPNPWWVRRSTVNAGFVVFVAAMVSLMRKVEFAMWCKFSGKLWSADSSENAVHEAALADHHHVCGAQWAALLESWPCLRLRLWSPVLGAPGEWCAWSGSRNCSQLCVCIFVVFLCVGLLRVGLVLCDAERTAEAGAGASRRVSGRAPIWE